MALQPYIYHERQSRQLCALHALNNLFQAANAFTKKNLDDICENLNPSVWCNPHRSMLGFGNYDINVIMQALEMRDCEAIWFDKRRNPNTIDISKVVGFILNVPNSYSLGPFTLPLDRRHWIAIRSIDGIYYNLDSKLSSPECIGAVCELYEFLQQQLATNERELFIIKSRSNIIVHSIIADSECFEDLKEK